MGIDRRFLAASLLFSLTGCSESMPVAPTPPPSPPSYVVSGIVRETVDGVSRPVANQFLSLHTQETEGLPPGMTLRGSMQYIHTDDSGRYSAQVPRSLVFVSAVWGKRQPCLASATVVRDTVIDVQVFPGSSDAPSPTPGSMITGFVYETTPEGRKPVQGASAWLDVSSDVYVASTETDAAGRFYFCRVNTMVRMDVSADGYQPYVYSEFVYGPGNRHFEFEFKR
jgi:hypothetical protein